MSDIPVFTYVPEPLSERVSIRMMDLMLLALYAVLFFMAAFVSFLRVDIT